MSPSCQIKKIVLLVPCYNEEENIPLFVAESKKQLQDFDWHIIFINDGSRDASWQIICDEATRNKRIHGINFARNFGHQNALKAGLEEAAANHPADAYITIDADLQHPVSLIPEMAKQCKPGIHIVQAQRIDTVRKISLFKKFSSSFFYKTFSCISGIPMQPGMSDFRLIDTWALNFIVASKEKDFFLRGLLPWSGLKTHMIPYVPGERSHGESRYTLRKMLSLSMSGIIGYSARPLHLSIVLGMLSILLSLAYFSYVIIITFCGERVEVGWPSVIGTILALGGIQLFIIGIVGIYLGKLFMEVKGRPSYVIGDKTN